MRLTNSRTSHPCAGDAFSDWTMPVTAGKDRSLRFGINDGLKSARRTTPLDTIICKDRAFIALRKAGLLL